MRVHWALTAFETWGQTGRFLAGCERSATHFIFMLPKAISGNSAPLRYLFRSDLEGKSHFFPISIFPFPISAPTRPSVRTHTKIRPHKNFQFNNRSAIPYHLFSVPGGSEVSFCLKLRIFDLQSTSPRFSPQIFEPEPPLSRSRPPAKRLFSIACTLSKSARLQFTHF